MKIVKLIYQSYFPQQGRYPRVSGQAKILKSFGHDITILACDREGTRPASEVLEGIPVERIRVTTGEMRGPLLQVIPLIVFYKRAMKWLRTHPVDILHCHNLDILPLGYLAKRRTGCRLVFEAHEPNYYALWPKGLKPLVWFMEWLDRFIARRCDAISVTNAYQVRKYQAQGVKRVEIMGNYPPPELRISRLNPAKFNQQDLILGRFGTFYAGVGLEETLPAYRQLLERRKDVKLILGGRVVDRYRDTFAALTASLGDRLECLGPYDASDMQALYGRIHISCLVYPKSDWFRNITPRKFFDSLANGVPVIITDIGELGDVVRRHQCGLVVDENDAKGIADAMETLARDRKLVRTLSENALALANTEYGWDRLCQKYNALMEDLYRGGTTPEPPTGQPANRRR